MFIRKDKESYSLLYEILGFLPYNLRPYQTAFTHSSYSSGHNKKLCNNERLEFLGDSILSSVASDFLYKKFRNQREGFLSKSRSKLVCRESLNKIATRIGLDKLIESTNKGQHHNTNIYGNAFEALIGAIYIDRGYDYCLRFVQEKVFTDDCNIEDMIKADNNYKSSLIEWSQKEHREVTFNLISEEKQNSDYLFTSEVLIDGDSYGTGIGFSKKESQQHAAKEAMERIKELR